MEPLPAPRDYPPAEMAARSLQFREDIARRRSVRDFQDRPVPREVIEHCLMAAGTAPSGANQQPWHFAVIGDPLRKRRIREAAEAPTSQTDLPRQSVMTGFRGMAAVVRSNQALQV